MSPTEWLFHVSGCRFSHSSCPRRRRRSRRLRVGSSQTACLLLLLLLLWFDHEFPLPCFFEGAKTEALLLPGPCPRHRLGAFRCHLPLLSPPSFLSQRHCALSATVISEREGGGATTSAATASSGKKLKRSKKTKQKSVKASSKKTSTGSRGKGKRSKANKKKDSDPMYWILDTGDVSLLRESSVEEADSNSLHSGVVTLLRFKVGGSPRPLQRHRTSRGFTYNPSASAQQSFREVVEKVVFGGSTHNDGEIPVNGDSSPQRHSPLWGSEHALAMSVVFRMKRPIVHFKSGRPGPGRLRDSAPAALGTASVGTDVDNLAKFVLDSLNGLIYADDRQIVSLQVSKVYDCVDECRGSTEVSIRLLKQEDEDFVTKL